MLQLADFGLSRVLDTNGTHVSTQTYGTLAYQPAELLRDGKLTKAVDIYSFGMIMWELYSGRRLFENNITGQVGAAPTSALPNSLAWNSPRIAADSVNPVTTYNVLSMRNCARMAVIPSLHGGSFGMCEHRIKAAAV